MSVNDRQFRELEGLSSFTFLFEGEVLSGEEDDIKSGSCKYQKAPGFGSALYKQQCTNGFDLDRQTGQCLDIDECRTIPEACRGDMMCVNQNGGYLCIPRTNPVYRGPYSNPYSTSYSGPYPAAAPPVPASNYPTISRPLVCRFGYQMDEGNQCVGLLLGRSRETQASGSGN
ncbi:hypothetical protein A6R68_18371, partial [Neotoma lepida]